MKSKPVRIFAGDDCALEALTRLLRPNHARVVHEALAEYLAHQGETAWALVATCRRTRTPGSVTMHNWADDDIAQG